MAGADIPSLWMFPSTGFSGVSWCHTGDCDGSHQPAPGPGLCHHEEDAHPLPHQPARKCCLPCPTSQEIHSSGAFPPGNAAFCSVVFEFFGSMSITRLFKGKFWSLGCFIWNNTVRNKTMSFSSLHAGKGWFMIVFCSGISTADSMENLVCSASGGLGMRWSWRTQTIPWFYDLCPSYWVLYQWGSSHNGVLTSKVALAILLQVFQSLLNDVTRQFCVSVVRSLVVTVGIPFWLQN